MPPSTAISLRSLTHDFFGLDYRLALALLCGGCESVECKGGAFLGSRGASSGSSVDRHGNSKNPYVSQYHSVLTVGNVKYVKYVQKTG